MKVKAARTDKGWLDRKLASLKLRKGFEEESQKLAVGEHRDYGSYFLSQTEQDAQPNGYEAMRFCPSPEQGRPTILMLPPGLLALSSWEGVLLDLPLRATLSPADSLAYIFHPPYPPIASQSISRDVPSAQARAFRFSVSLFRGVAKAALDCAHRTVYMLPPSLLDISLGMGGD